MLAEGRFAALRMALRLNYRCDRLARAVAGRMFRVKRRGLVLGVMVVGISLMLWAGWHNLRERRLAMQRAQENRVVLVPNGAGQVGQAQGGQAQGDTEQPSLRGKAAPAFVLSTLDGKKVSLSDYRGRAVLVNFWATWCGPCKVEMPWFEEFQKQYAGQGFVILGLADDVDAGKDAIRKVAQKTGVTYPILLTDGKVQKAYGGVDVLPMSFYVDRNGVVVEETAGLGSKDEIEAHIKKAIASGAGSIVVGGQ
jgi:thiol-disulfide isomerase/thioredoxin